MTSVGRQTINVLLPPGPLYQPRPGGDLDKLLDGIAVGYDSLADFLSGLQYIRDPAKTPVFTDLEREFGIRPNSNVPMVDRIARLSRKVYQADKTGTIDDMQDALDAAGFDLQVHINDPPVDPSQFIGGDPWMVAGGGNAYAGFEPLAGPPSTAIAGYQSVEGKYIVNPEIQLQSVQVEMVAGGDLAYAGEPEACASYFTQLTLTALTYPNPPAAFYGMVFFIGGDATRDPVTGEITNIVTAQVANNRWSELITTILNIKPMMAWAALIAEKV